MNVSYEDPIVRDYCSSLRSDQGGNPFSPTEIKEIRAHIADLRASPSLSDAPVDFILERAESGTNLLSLNFHRVKITCSVISPHPYPQIHQIKRVKILDIIRTDLQLPNSEISMV